MNKKLLTIALAAAMVAPVVASADTTLYGRVDNALVYGDDDSATGGAWDVTTGTSRIGLKGAEDLGNGLKAIFQYEFSADTSESASGGTALGNRLGYVGLSGGFGTIAIGKQWTPYYGTVDKTDIFNNPGSSSTNSASSNAYYQGPARTGNAIAYISPNFNGFTAKVALVVDGTSGGTTSQGLDAYNISLDYNNGPLSLGVSSMQYDSAVSATGDMWGLAGAYNFGNFKLVGQYEDTDNASGVKAAYALAAEAYFGNNTVRALFGSQDNTTGADYDTWSLGLQHNFSKRTFTYVEYASSETSATATETQFTVGLRHDF